MKNFKKSIKSAGPNPRKFDRDRRVPRPEGGEDRPSFGPQILISPDKKDFVISAKLAGVPTVTSSYAVKGGVHQPNLILDPNRWGRADNLLKSAPDLITLHSDGQSLAIDATSKMLAIDAAIADVTGIVQYRTGEDLKPEILANFVRREYEPIYLATDIANEDDEERANELFVFPISGYGGFLVGITNGVEKYLHLSIGRDGLVAWSEKHEYKRLMAVMQQWEGLGLTAAITGNRLMIECKTLREHLPFDRGVMTIHDNYAGEWTITPAYELVV